ncbi:MAG: AAA family ATPase [Bacteroidales bacterium]|nr:AAA family ATPase [Bacteroidales bacterium]
MIDTVNINNFRGIHHSKIEGMSQVNLFFGKNNCGKSSLLEGIFLACGQSNPLLPATINAMRTYTRLTENDIRYFFYKMDDEKEIQISILGSQERHLNITAIKSVANNLTNAVSTDLSHQYGLRMKFNNNDGEYASEVLYDLGASNQIEQKINIDTRYNEILKCVYLSPRYDSNASVDGLQNIYMNKDENFLAEALKILEPNADNPIFIDSVMWVDVGLPQRIPINLMGDGIRKIVSFLTSIYACRGGVVLIDELSNGFHYSVMKPMWEIVIRAAIKNDVQIFATTHDEDAIRGFQQAALAVAGESKNEIATGFKLQRIADDELRAYRFSVSELGYAMEQEMEVR